jgi:hypothetical protein
LLTLLFGGYFFKTLLGVCIFYEFVHDGFPYFIAKSYHLFMPTYIYCLNVGRSELPKLPRIRFCSVQVADVCRYLGFYCYFVWIFDDCIQVILGWIYLSALHHTFAFNIIFFLLSLFVVNTLFQRWK